MTTESQLPHRRGASPLLGSIALSFLATGILTALGGIFGGAAGARGAAAGAIATCLTFGWGVYVVGVVAKVMPSASLLIALLTYALQLLVMGVAVKVIMNASAGGEWFAHGWVAAGVAVLGVTWMAAQVWTTVRLRTLAYDLPSSAQRSGTEAGE